MNAGATLDTAGVPSADQITAMSPGELTTSFYTWHINLDENRLEQRAEWNLYLTPRLIEQINSIVASFDEQGGFDPFLCAQDAPTVFEVDEAEVAETTAQAVVRLDWGPGTEAQMTDIRVDLFREEEDAGWKIDVITCPQPGPVLAETPPVLDIAATEPPLDATQPAGPDDPALDTTTGTEEP